MNEEQIKAALEAHRAKHDNPWSFAAQSELQALHLAAAELLERSGDEAGLEHLRVAEDCQWRLGAESTSAGEGMASMATLYELRARRARLHEKLGQSAEALDLWDSIAADPNGLGQFAVAEAARLRGA